MYNMSQSFRSDDLLLLNINEKTYSELLISRSPDGRSSRNTVSQNSFGTKLKKFFSRK